jgi:probable addiction module antidote protein
LKTDYKSCSIEKLADGNPGDAKPVGEGGQEQIMPKIKTSKYDVAEHLRTPEDMAAYLEACIEEANGDSAFIAKGLGDIARAKGMSQVARDAGLSWESLYGQRSLKI